MFDCAKAELADCNETEIFVDIVYAPLLEHTIEGLDNFTEYKIKIDLYNGISPGPNTTEMVIYTDEDSKNCCCCCFDSNKRSMMECWYQCNMT